MGDGRIRREAFHQGSDTPIYTRKNGLGIYRLDGKRAVGVRQWFPDRKRAPCGALRIGLSEAWKLAEAGDVLRFDLCRRRYFNRLRSR